MKRFTWLSAFVVALALCVGALGAGIAPAHAATLDDSYIEIEPTAHLATQDYEDKEPGAVTDPQTGILYTEFADKSITTDASEAIGGEKSMKFNFAGKQDYKEFASGQFAALGFQQNKSYAVSFKMRLKGISEFLLSVIYDYGSPHDANGCAYEYGLQNCQYDAQGNLIRADWRPGWQGSAFDGTNRSKDIEDGVVTVYFEVTFPDKAFGEPQNLRTGMPIQIVSAGDCSVVFDDFVVDELPRVSHYYTKRVDENFDDLIGAEGDLWKITPIWRAADTIGEELVTEDDYKNSGLFVIDGTASLGFTFGTGSNLAVGGIRVENTAEENVFVSFDVNLGTVSMLNVYTLTLGTQQYCSVQYHGDSESWKTEGSVTGLTASVKETREEFDNAKIWSVSFYLPIGTDEKGISINFNVDSEMENEVLIFDNFVLAYEDYAPYVKAAPATMTITDPKDVEIAFDGKGKELEEVKLGERTLTQTDEYTVAENKITLPKKLFTEAKDYTVSVTTTGGGTSELTVSVKKAAITAITGVTVKPKPYDGSANAELDFSATQFVGAEGAEVAVSATAVFADAHAGENKAVTVSDIALTQGGDKYELAEGLAIEGLTGAISKKNIKVTGGITASDKVYDGTAAATLDATAATFDGKVGGDELTVSVEGTFADKNVGADKAISIGSFTLGGAAKDDYTLTEVEAADLKAAITQKAIASAAVTVSERAYDGTTVAPVDFAAAVLDGVAEDDEVTLTGTAAFADKNVGTAKPITFSALALSGADAGNYSIEGLTLTATGNIKPLAITQVGGVTAQDKVYDGTTAATADFSKATFTGKLEGDDLTLDAAHCTAAFSDKNVGTKAILVTLAFTGADKDNYSVEGLSIEGLTAKITAKEITVTAEPKEIAEGEEDVALTYTVEGLVTGDTLTGELAREEGTKAGEYAITQGTLTGGDNYTITFEGATYTIKAAPKKKGCGGMLAGGAFGLLALACAGLLALKKHK